MVLRWYFYYVLRMFIKLLWFMHLEMWIIVCRYRIVIDLSLRFSSFVCVELKLVHRSVNGENAVCLQSMQHGMLQVCSFFQVPHTRQMYHQCWLWLVMIFLDYSPLILKQLPWRHSVWCWSPSQRSPWIMTFMTHLESFETFNVSKYFISVSDLSVWMHIISHFIPT